MDRKTFIETTHRLDQLAEVKIWDITNPPEGLEIPGNGRAVSSIAFRPDGKHLAAGYHGGDVAVWDTVTGKQVQLPRDNLATEWYGTDGKTLRDRKTGHQVGVLRHDSDVTSIKYHPDGNTIAVAQGRFLGPGEPGGLHLWDANSGVKLRNLPIPGGGVFTLAFHPKGTEIVAGCWDNDAIAERPPGEPKDWPIFLGGFMTQVRARGLIDRLSVVEKQ
jgi:WD40 repeat protein